ncbi:hypothetical protein GW17_00010908 [Ensete ventricosum]|nr:hypothetical protein GW17_00010908 [Ensete ventricosum]RZS21759.1 hypothetical protein BHM03_00054432 [Ensete ventricosum]
MQRPRFPGIKKTRVPQHRKLTGIGESDDVDEDRGDSRRESDQQTELQDPHLLAETMMIMTIILSRNAQDGSKNTSGSFLVPSTVESSRGEGREVGSRLRRMGPCCVVFAMLRLDSGSNCNLGRSVQ